MYSTLALKYMLNTAIAGNGLLLSEIDLIHSDFFVEYLNSPRNGFLPQKHQHRHALSATSLSGDLSEPVSTSHCLRLPRSPFRKQTGVLPMEDLPMGESCLILMGLSLIHI